jgi:hypothetical protein
MYKILSNILLPRLTLNAEEIVGNHQGGFCYNRSTMNHVFSIRQILGGGGGGGRKKKERGRWLLIK